MRMLRDKVLVRPDTQVSLSDVIVLTEDTTAKALPVGAVLAVGPDVSEVVVGDTVHYERFDWCSAPGECIVIAEGEIIAKETR